MVLLDAASVRDAVICGTCTRDVCWGPRERARRDSRQVALPMPGTYAGTLPGPIDGVDGPILGESRSASPTQLRGMRLFWRCSLTKLQQWNLVDVSTPVTPNTATYDCPWSPFGMGKDKPCTTDRDCTWLGSPAGMCSKCHKIPGARAICGPTK